MGEGEDVIRKQAQGSSKVTNNILLAKLSDECLGMHFIIITAHTLYTFLLYT